MIKFSIRGDDYYVRARSTDYVNMGHHLCLAFEVLKEAGTLEYSSGAKCPIGSNCILIYRPDESSSTKLPTKPVPVRSNEKHSEQIDYFNKQIEELNISIQQYDDVYSTQDPWTLLVVITDGGDNYNGLKDICEDYEQVEHMIWIITATGENWFNSKKTELMEQGVPEERILFVDINREWGCTEDMVKAHNK